MEERLKEVINAAVDNNSIGCALYLNKRTLESRVAFRGAASILQHLLDAVLQVTCYHDSQLLIQLAREAASETSRWIGENWQDYGGPGGETRFRFTSQHEEYHSVLFVNDVIKIPKSSSELPTPIHLVINRATAAVLLNLAQTYLGGDDPDMSHAMALYETSYNLVMKYPLTCFLSEKIALVALNNATHLRREYGDFEIAHCYVTTMIQVIQVLPPSAETPRKEFRRQFLLNAMVMNMPVITAARAA